MRIKSTKQTRRFRFWLWLIHVIGVIVPRRLRADWRQEWQAELINGTFQAMALDVMPPRARKASAPSSILPTTRD